jgi:hypothetical protein
MPYGASILLSKKERALKTFKVLMAALVVVCFLGTVASYSWAVEARKPLKPGPAPASPSSTEPAKKVAPATTQTVPKAQVPSVQPIIINSPGGGDTVFLNHPCEIKWSKFGQMDNVVDIYAVKAGTNVTFGIVGKTLNDGAYSWTVLGLTPGKYAIRIITNDKASQGEGSAFDAVNPAVEVVSPGQGATWYAGETRSITWKPSMLPDNAKVTIEMIRSSDSKKVKLADSLSNSGAYPWKITGALLSQETQQGALSAHTIYYDTKGTLRLTAVADGRTYTAEKPITLAPPRIRITNPKEGDTWYVGKTYTVTWEKEGPSSSTATLEIGAGGLFIPSLYMQTPNSGSVSITLPPTVLFPNWTMGYAIKLFADVEGFGSVGSSVSLNIVK